MNRIFQNVLRQSVARGNSTILSNQICATYRLFSDAKGPAALGKEDLDKLVRTNKVVIFMKGNPEAPRCGFSNAVVQIMRMHGVQYDAHDVLKSEELRQGVKDYTDWPTIPQVFINGEFVGGCDILLQMHQSGDLIEELKKVGITSDLLALAEAEKATAKKEEKKK